MLPVCTDLESIFVDIFPGPGTLLKIGIFEDASFRYYLRRPINRFYCSDNIIWRGCRVRFHRTHALG